MASGNDSGKKGTHVQLSFIEESEIQPRSQYEQFISSKYVAVSQLNVRKWFREPSRIPVKELEHTPNKSRRKR